MIYHCYFICLKNYFSPEYDKISDRYFYRGLNEHSLEQRRSSSSSDATDMHVRKSDFGYVERGQRRRVENVRVKAGGVGGYKSMRKQLCASCSRFAVGCSTCAPHCPPSRAASFAGGREVAENKCESIGSLIIRAPARPASPPSSLSRWKSSGKARLLEQNARARAPNPEARERDIALWKAYIRPARLDHGRIKHSGATRKMRRETRYKNPVGANKALFVRPAIIRSLLLTSFRACLAFLRRLTVGLSTIRKNSAFVWDSTRIRDDPS